MPTNSGDIVADNVLAEVEARNVVDHHIESGAYMGCYILLSTSERNALCQTVRALRAALEESEAHNRVLRDRLVVADGVYFNWQQ